MARDCLAQGIARKAATCRSHCSYCDRTLVDYERLTAILGHPSLLERLSHDRRDEIARVLLDNIEHLYPIAEAISRFFQTFDTGPQHIRRRIAKGLLKSVKSFRGRWPPDYHMIWVLSVFASSANWGGATEILGIFRHTPPTLFVGSQLWPSMRMGLVLMLWLSGMSMPTLRR